MKNNVRGGSTLCCCPFDCPSAKSAGTVNGGQCPFILTVDSSGLFCNLTSINLLSYIHISLQILYSLTITSYRAIYITLILLVCLQNYLCTFVMLSPKHRHHLPHIVLHFENHSMKLVYVVIFD